MIYSRKFFNNEKNLSSSNLLSVLFSKTWSAQSITFKVLNNPFWVKADFAQKLSKTFAPFSHICSNLRERILSPNSFSCMNWREQRSYTVPRKGQNMTKKFPGQTIYFWIVSETPMLGRFFSKTKIKTFHFCPKQRGEFTKLLVIKKKCQNSQQ